MFDMRRREFITLLGGAADHGQYPLTADRVGTPIPALAKRLDRSNSQRITSAL